MCSVLVALRVPTGLSAVSILFYCWKVSGKIPSRAITYLTTVRRSSIAKFSSNSDNTMILFVHMTSDSAEVNLVVASKRRVIAPKWQVVKNALCFTLPGIGRLSCALGVGGGYPPRTSPLPGTTCSRLVALILRNPRILTVARLASQTSSRLIPIPINVATMQEFSGETSRHHSPPRRSARVGEDSGRLPTTLNILPRSSGRQSLTEAIWQCASEEKCETTAADEWCWFWYGPVLSQLQVGRDSCNTCPVGFYSVVLGKVDECRNRKTGHEEENRDVLQDKKRWYERDCNAEFLGPKANIQERVQFENEKSRSHAAELISQTTTITGKGDFFHRDWETRIQATFFDLEPPETRAMFPVGEMCPANIAQSGGIVRHDSHVRKSGERPLRESTLLWCCQRIASRMELHTVVFSVDGRFCLHTRVDHLGYMGNVYLVSVIYAPDIRAQRLALWIRQTVAATSSTLFDPFCRHFNKSASPATNLVQLQLQAKEARSTIPQDVFIRHMSRCASMCNVQFRNGARPQKSAQERMWAGPRSPQLRTQFTHASARIAAAAAYQQRRIARRHARRKLTCDNEPTLLRRRHASGSKKFGIFDVHSELYAPSIAAKRAPPPPNNENINVGICGTQQKLRTPKTTAKNTAKLHSQELREFGIVSTTSQHSSRYRYRLDTVSTVVDSTERRNEWAGKSTALNVTSKNYSSARSNTHAIASQHSSRYRYRLDTPDGKVTVWRIKNGDLEGRSLTATVKYGGIQYKFRGAQVRIVWGPIEGIVDKYDYPQILKDHLAATVVGCPGTKYKKTLSNKHYLKVVMFEEWRKIPKGKNRKDGEVDAKSLLKERWTYEFLNVIKLCLNKNKFSWLGAARQLSMYVGETIADLHVIHAPKIPATGQHTGACVRRGKVPLPDLVRGGHYWRWTRGRGTCDAAPMGARARRGSTTKNLTRDGHQLFVLSMQTWSLFTDTVTEMCGVQQLCNRAGRLEEVGPVPRPTRSPDLSPLDFFFWGCLKSRVYSGRRSDMKPACSGITPRHARLPRIAACVRSDGAYFEQHVFSSERNSEERWIRHKATDTVYPERRDCDHLRVYCHVKLSKLPFVVLFYSVADDVLLLMLDILNIRTCPTPINTLHDENTERQFRALRVDAMEALDACVWLCRHYSPVLFGLKSAEHLQLNIACKISVWTCMRISVNKCSENSTFFLSKASSYSLAKPAVDGWTEVAARKWRAGPLAPQNTASAMDTRSPAPEQLAARYSRGVNPSFPSVFGELFVIIVSCGRISPGHGELEGRVRGRGGGGNAAVETRCEAHPVGGRAPASPPRPRRRPVPRDVHCLRARDLANSPPRSDPSTAAATTHRRHFHVLRPAIVFNHELLTGPFNIQFDAQARGGLFHGASRTRCDKRAENLPRRERNANPRSLDYRSATLPLNYGGRAPSTIPYKVSKHEENIPYGDKSPLVSGTMLSAVRPTPIKGCVAEERDGEHNDRDSIGLGTGLHMRKLLAVWQGALSCCKIPSSRGKNYHVRVDVVSKDPDNIFSTCTADPDIDFCVDMKHSLDYRLRSLSIIRGALNLRDGQGSPLNIATGLRAGSGKMRRYQRKESLRLRVPSSEVCDWQAVLDE
ncbi:hypothetical protein PR048_011647 [Dryococelus australis]|uniref:Uncharacterized protein n=1 Tax=Dryococelus australis TaxID=614101 RepID=A0ABQ9HM48_9NEOP|nr:hypothetical protein PR048_011647 [Dryococelus australis]